PFSWFGGGEDQSRENGKQDEPEPRTPVRRRQPPSVSNPATPITRARLPVVNETPGPSTRGAASTSQNVTRPTTTSNAIFAGRSSLSQRPPADPRPPTNLHARRARAI